jgi:L-iditol 2-dehydrogenase
MKAVELYGQERAELVERPTPRPAPGELLLAPLAVGVCGTDAEIYEGSMVYFRTGIARYPVVPGHEWVAEVIEVGENVEDFHPGERVVGECSIGCGRCMTCLAGRYHLCRLRTETGILNRDGAMAERMLFPARSAFAIPANVSASAAVLVEPTAVALNAVRRVSVAGQTVLVLGGGTIGLLALQCAIASGADEVLIAEPSAGRREIAERLRAGSALAISGDRCEDAATLQERVGVREVDTVIVCTGAPSALAFALDNVRLGGTIVAVGLTSRSDLPVDVDRLVVGDITLHGVLGSPGCWPDTIRLIASGQVATEPLVGAPFPITRVDEALEDVRDQANGTPKVLIDPRQAA